MLGFRLPEGRTLLGWAIIAMIVYWVVQNPHHAALDVRGIIAKIAWGANQVLTFVSEAA